MLPAYILWFDPTWDRTQFTTHEASLVNTTLSSCFITLLKSNSHLRSNDVSSKIAFKKSQLKFSFVVLKQLFMCTHLNIYTTQKKFSNTYLYLN